MKMNKLFVVLLLGTIFLMSCGKPTVPESLNPGGDGGYKIVSRLSTTGYAQDLIKKDNMVYIAQGEGGLMIVDVSLPSNPVVASITTKKVRGYSSRIEMKDSVAYLAAGGFGVTVVDVADPFAPFVTVSNSQMKPAKSLHIFGSYIIVGLSEQGFIISNISNPSYPFTCDDTEVPGYAQGINTTADSALLLVACGEVGLSIFDISDFQEGWGIYPLINTCDTRGYANDVIIDDESLAYLACGTAGLQIIDFSDTAYVYVIGSYDGDGYAKDLMLRNNKIYLATEKGGLQIIDVSDPTNPNLLGIVETEYALGFDMDDNYIYLADEAEGLIVISIPD